MVEEEISETLVTEEVFEADAEDSEENTPTLKAGEFSGSKEEEKEEIQQLHTKYQRPVPVIDHRLLAGKLARVRLVERSSPNRMCAGSGRGTV